MQTAQVETAFIDPGKPWQNGTDESFNGKFRNEHLSLPWFRHRVEAKVAIEQWRQHYNEVRPHSSLGYLTPLEFKATCTADRDGGRSLAAPARADEREQRTEPPLTAGSLQALAAPVGFAAHLEPTRHTDWVVYAKRPFAGPQQVLEYVGRYTHRVAIANHRVIDMDDGHVRFHYKNYRAEAAQAPQTMTLEAPEFLRRFLLHVLPSGFHRIRYYDWLGHRLRTETLARCRQLLGTIPTPAVAPPRGDETTPPSDYRDRYESLTGVSLRRCPVCADGHMTVTLSWVRGGAGPVMRPDTS